MFIGIAGACVDVLQRHRIVPRVRGERLEGVRVLVGEIAEARDALAKLLQGAGADASLRTAPKLATLGAWHPDVMLSAKEDEPGTLLATVARLKA